MASSCSVNFYWESIHGDSTAEDVTASHWSCILSISVQALIAIFSLIEWDDLELWSASQGKLLGWHKLEGRLMDWEGGGKELAFASSQNKSHLPLSGLEAGSSGGSWPWISTIRAAEVLWQCMSQLGCCISCPVCRSSIQCHHGGCFLLLVGLT